MAKEDIMDFFKDLSARTLGVISSRKKEPSATNYKFVPTSGTFASNQPKKPKEGDSVEVKPNEFPAESTRVKSSFNKPNPEAKAEPEANKPEANHSHAKTTPKPTSEPGSKPSTQSNTSEVASYILLDGSGGLIEYRLTRRDGPGPELAKWFPYLIVNYEDFFELTNKEAEKYREATKATKD